MRRSFFATRQLTRGRNIAVSIRSLYWQRDVQERIEQRVRQEVRLQAKVDQLGVLRVVVVLFLLDARIRQVIDGDLEADPGGSGLNEVGELENGELLGELVVDPTLTRARPG